MSDQDRGTGTPKPGGPAAQDGRAPASDALRIGIDGGAGADKVRYPDPAAAPLGTDDEAAGTPPTPEQRRMAAAHEIRRPDPLPEDAAPTSRFSTALLVLLAALVFVLVLILLLTRPV